MLREIREECNQGSGYVSSDGESAISRIADPTVVTEEDYREMLRAHRKKRKADLKVVLLNVDVLLYIYVTTSSLVAILSGFNTCVF